MSELPPSLQDEIRLAVRAEVAAGYLDDDEIEIRVVERFLDDLDSDSDSDVDEPNIERVVDRLLAEEHAAHLIAQAAWPQVTDYDRLANAFTELDRSGIVAREHFTCCGTCGAAEIWDEVRKHGRAARGYTFFHMQDTERAVEGGGVFLAYGSTGPAEGDAVQVAAEVVEVLQRHGLAPSWDGSPAKRVHVPLDWKRRR